MKNLLFLTDSDDIKVIGYHFKFRVLAMLFT
jgi:hypothetical protein